MNIVCTGGRNYENYAMVDNVLNRLKINEVFVGDASGADSLVIQWCYMNDIPYKIFEAEWDTHGKAAGPIRNREMLLAAKDATVIAFPGGRGTESCVSIAKELNMIVLRVEK